MGIRNLGSLEVFVALADTQSFTEAAKRLGMTTSAASQALRALEEELAVSLISRKSRPVMLTGAGRNLLDGARALLRASAVRSGLISWERFFPARSNCRYARPWHCS